MAPNLRSSGAHAVSAASSSAVEDSRPPKKKRQTEISKFTCTSCGAIRMAKFFPDVNPSAECDHLINTCSGCLRKWVEARVGSSRFEYGSDGKTFGVRCPECAAVMREVNVEDAAAKRVFQRFQELARRHVANTVPGWRWCVNARCNAGQVHESKQSRTRSKRSIKPEEDPNICICNECGSKTCVHCNRIHYPETCSAYQARIKGRTDEDDLSLAMLQKISKPCPSCSRPIEKAGGCDSMHCSSCNAHFCWQCQGIVSNAGCKCTARFAAEQAAALPLA